MVVRSLTTVCNVVSTFKQWFFEFLKRKLILLIIKLLTYVFFGEKTSFKAMMCCGIIIVGFLLGIDQEKGLGNK
jgi:GDP-fucose transporter C1